MRILLVTLLLLAGRETLAEQTDVPLDKLVEQSDAVVVGTLNEVIEFSKGKADYGMAKTDYGRGIITVHEVLWGTLKPGDRLPLGWENSFVCPRVEHSYHQGKRLIWLLTYDDLGYVRADQPGRRVVPLDKKALVAGILKANPDREPKSFVPRISLEKLVVQARRVITSTHIVAGIAILAGMVLAYVFIARRKAANKRMKSDQ